MINIYIFPGIAQCLICLWTHLVQKKMLDWSMRKNMGRLKVGCSIHISYSKSASTTKMSGQSKGLPNTSLNRHLSRVGQTRLSTSLSSLSHKGPPVVGTHLSRYQRGSATSRLVRSSDVLSSKTCQSNGISFL